MEIRVKKSCELEVTDELRAALDVYQVPVVIHKHNGTVRLYSVLEVSGLDLFHMLHHGHDDIIREMIFYGNYLLHGKLRKTRKSPHLKLIEKK